MTSSCLYSPFFYDGQAPCDVIASNLQMHAFLKFKSRSNDIFLFQKRYIFLPFWACKN